MNKIGRSLMVAGLMMLTVGMLFARGSYEQRRNGVEGDFTVVKLGVMQGPTGFSSVGLNRSEGVVSDSTKVELSVYPSPNEVVARLTTGELDIAALPTNVAANLYNKGIGVKVAAVIGDGMLKVVSSDPNVNDFNQLVGTTVSIPGANSTPDQVSTILAEAAGMQVGKDIVFDYSIAAPAQLAQMVIAGKVKVAVLPEPFVTMVMAQNANVQIVANMEELWRVYVGGMDYPMSVLVVTDSFREAFPFAWGQVLSAYSESVNWVNSNPIEAGKAIEAAGIMKAAMATPAIPNCALVYKQAQDAKGDMEVYFKTLLKYNPASIGGKLPDGAFYLD